MKERPILMSAPMVRSTLADTKTQTRRVVKPEGAHELFQFRGTTAAAGADEPTGEWAWCGHPRVVGKHIRCPYGKPGDRLWVRETFQPLFAEGFDHYTSDWETGKGYAVRYVASDGRIEWIDGDDNITDRCKPGIHMPRWASRININVTGVRVERLQDISEADAIAEGIEQRAGSLFEDRCKWRIYGTPDTYTSDPVSSYQSLWELINGAGSWDLNPYVWAIAFERAAK